MARIAFLGLGAMGSRMAANLIEAGNDLTVWNRDPAKMEPLALLGAGVARTPREAAQGAEVVIAMVRDDEASRAVWTDPETGALASMSGNALAVECSTLSLEWTRTLAAACGEAGIDFVDAPLAGSRPQAEAKALIFFAGGEAECVARAEKVLLGTGSALHHAGPAGAGMAVKLAVNTLLGLQVAAMAELMETLRREGLDPSQALAIIGATPVCASAAKVAAEMMLNDRFAPLFPVDLVAKDLGYSLEAAGGGRLASLTKAALDVYRAAGEAGYGSDHMSGVVKLYRD